MLDDSISHLTNYALDISQLEREIAKDAKLSFKEFVHQAWPIVCPDDKLDWNWHHELICDKLESVSRGEIKRLIINIPPGCSKSTIITVLWPCWEWSTKPYLRYLAFSYSDSNSIRDSVAARELIQSDWYQSNFGIQLSKYQFSKRRFRTINRGFRFASSVGGAGTGEHPDRIIIDDPSKADDGIVDLENTWKWYKNTVATRINRNPAIIIVMQRLSLLDLCHYVKTTGTWDEIILPMRYEASKGRTYDPRTVEGELLWPSRFNEEAVTMMEAVLGIYGAQAQLQQNPTSEKGSIFKRSDFQIVDAVPAEIVASCRGWDRAATQGGGDYTAGVKVSLAKSGMFYVEHLVHEQLDPDGVDDLMKQCAALDGTKCIIREERQGADGKSVTLAHARMLAGYDYAEVIVGQDKLTRATPFRAQLQVGNVRLVRGDWNEKYINEFARFNNGAKHDDMVDATSCAFNALVQMSPNKKKTRAVWGRNIKKQIEKAGLG